MTKEVFLNTTQIEVRAWDRIKSFTQNQILGWTSTGLFASVVGLVVYIFHNEKDEMRKRISKLEDGHVEINEKVEQILRHGKKQSEDEIDYLKKIMKKLDEKRPEIWEEIS